MRDEKKEEVSGDSDQKALTPTLTALLKPTADYLGQEIKKTISDKVDQLKERRRQANLLQHINNVTRKTGIDAEVVAGERQLNLFQEWVQGAQEIPKEDKVLSLMWEELLMKILKGIDFEGQLMRALSRLSESDAVLLLKFSRTSKYRPKSRKERYQIEQPQFYNLVETSSVSNGINIALAILCFLSFSSLLYFDAKDLMQSKFDTVAAATASAYGLLYRLLPKFGLIAGVGGVLALIAWRFIPSRQLTWFGSELLKQARVSNDEIQIIENQG